jgi:hypothetical protein
VSKTGIANDTPDIDRDVIAFYETLQPHFNPDMVASAGYFQHQEVVTTQYRFGGVDRQKDLGVDSFQESWISA